VPAASGLAPSAAAASGFAPSVFGVSGFAASATTSGLSTRFGTSAGGYSRSTAAKTYSASFALFAISNVTFAVIPGSSRPSGFDASTSTV